MKTGVLVINKSKNMTSHDVVSILRKKLNMKKIGHTGTLDPIATGVLPICIGNATRISQYIMEQGKEYIAKFKFGFETTTYDITGDVVNKSEKTHVSEEEIKKVLKEFIGKINQKPPIYSAKKIDGKKLYEYARKNKKIEIPSREIIIHDIELLSIENNEYTIRVNCSKGTYIRSLIHDIGIKLDTFAFMTELKRVRVGNFVLENSIDIKNIEKISVEEMYEKIYTIRDSLYQFKELHVDKDIHFRLVNGQRINKRDINFDLSEYVEDKEISIIHDEKLIGLAKINNNILKMERVFDNSY